MCNATRKSHPLHPQNKRWQVEASTTLNVRLALRNPFNSNLSFFKFQWKIFYRYFDFELTILNLASNFSAITLFYLSQVVDLVHHVTIKIKINNSYLVSINFSSIFQGIEPGYAMVTSPVLTIELCWLDQNDIFTELCPYITFLFLLRCYCCWRPWSISTFFFQKNKI